jgi:hypothetical protein
MATRKADPKKPKAGAAKASVSDLPPSKKKTIKVKGGTTLYGFASP